MRFLKSQRSLVLSLWVHCHAMCLLFSTSLWIPYFAGYKIERQALRITDYVSRDSEDLYTKRIPVQSSQGKTTILYVHF